MRPASVEAAEATLEKIWYLAAHRVLTESDVRRVLDLANLIKAQVHQPMDCDAVEELRDWPAAAE